MKRAPAVALAFLAIAASGCVHDARSNAQVPQGALRDVGVGAFADPTVKGARVVPQSVTDAPSLGREPGGGVRAIVAGLRVIKLPGGAVLSAHDRLPQGTATVPKIAAVPERLGGGFLFVLGNTVWRADTWLAPVQPIFGATSQIQAIVPGLDRVYLRLANGAFTAIDGATGERRDLGPWPRTPQIGRMSDAQEQHPGFAAADGWRAIAIADLRGLIATSDAGATWRTLDVPVEPKDVIAIGDRLYMKGSAGTRFSDAWFEIGGDGQITRLPRKPTGDATVSTNGATGDASLEARPLGDRPLDAALADGWPLSDGTAIVARDGALARVRLSDGAVTDYAKDAFPESPSSCHALSLTRDQSPGEFGFVCGEPRGTTAIYAYDAAKGTVAALRRFDTPRAVLSSGNGAIVVRGACDSHEKTSSDDNERPYCVLGHDNAWREINVRGEVRDERVVAMKDGRVIVVSPPLGDLTHARMHVLDHGRTRTIAITFPELRDPVAHVMELGVWLDGFEERAGGKIGGWIEAAGTMLGIEIAPDGSVELGQYIHDAGTPIVSGRYGLGWTNARRGFETIDGGMTWRPVELPEPLPSKTQERACGPAGCVMAGWIRVGWGEAKKAAAPDAPPVFGAHSVYPPGVSMNCERASPPQPDAPHMAARTTPAPRPPNPFSTGVHLRYTISSFGAPQPTQAFASVPFYSLAPPPTHADERAYSFEAAEPIEHFPRNGSLARVYVAAPKNGDATAGTTHWTVRWVSPFGGWQDVQSSPTLSAPPPVLEIARFASASSYYYGNWAAFQLGAGDDDAHALLAMRRLGHPEAVIFDLDADRAPVEITRADGEPFLEVDSVVRTNGRWYIATPPPANSAEPPRTTVWQVDGSVARPLARIVRAANDAARPTGSHLARRADTGAVGLVVDGQPNAEHGVAERWVLPISGENGRGAEEPEPLGAIDLSSKTISACAPADGGWIVDEPWSGQPRLAGAVSGTLSSALLRMRLTRDHACLERIAGTLHASADNSTHTRTTHANTQTTASSSSALPSPPTPTILVAASTGPTRQLFRCTLAH